MRVAKFPLFSVTCPIPCELAITPDAASLARLAVQYDE